MFFLGGVLFLFLFVLPLYNRLISKKNEVQNALGGLDVQLKKRYDLIPNLVAAVQQYLKHEASTFEKIVQLRTQLLNKNVSLQDKQELNTEISHKLSALLVQIENYPQLTSNTNFINLQNTLTNVEDDISAARRFYNTAVTDYNDAIEQFPSNLFAKMMKLQRKEVFTLPENERKNISVKSLFSNKAA
jgi:LemA protein